jgi:predicted ATP-grasp superfamily ATP-dependent carboligase
LPKRVLIAGVSTRAAAESAARAGFRPTAIDAFVDLDQHASVLALSPSVRYSPHAAAKASRDFECEAVVYLSGFENHPSAVTTLGAGRALWGNTPETLARARDPEAVFSAFVGRGHPAPRVWCPTASTPTTGASVRDTVPRDGCWLLKPLAAGGGHGVEPWGGGRPLPPRSYLQEFVPGAPGSIAFVAAGGSVAPLGVSRQLIGDAAFGASGFQYAGSVLSAGTENGFDKGPGVIELASRLAATAARRFGLVGVNGIDFVVRDGVPFPVEINPRWCASMELVELGFGLSVFQAHAEACASGVLPAFEAHRARSPQNAGSGAIGKAVVFARDNVTIGETSSWRSDSNGNIRDIPRPGTRVRRGRPVCTVFATGRDEDACYDALRERASDIYSRLEPWRSGRASGRVAKRVGTGGTSGTGGG